ncbi:putative colanic acid biosynthesis acetyltransferase [Bradyrhizobium yuanmingense]|uniref:putative colanic acid biosynthesis acetyltransferase n=1 Tax=Bradyrhizobium yuanmingense TaxID=108015 RepID=UPI0012FB71D5|nr:putative colanic acid biosynthesis acetyltransferase [Bradyrhizobium yuanmingense]MVT53322.1 putative colanic acid biosynthesis acetyltransferase [Bradyrhizobium yuanmingense]
MKPLDAKHSNSVVGEPSFPLSNRMIRALWNITWLLLASWTPPPLNPWRRFLLRLFGAKIASTARIYGSAKIWFPPYLTMGEHSVLAWGALCYSQAPIVLEDFVVVSQRAHLCAGTHDIDDPNFQLLTKPILLKRKAWVAADTFIGPGVTVGEGAVIGARAVVFKDVDPWSVFVGNPARFVKMRKCHP